MEGLSHHLSLSLSLSPLKGGTDSSISPPQISSSREQETDKGPDPLDKGFPQFWDARAAQVAALFGNGYGGKAELEWQQLCTSHPPPPPSVPKSKVKQYVNRAAQRMLDAETKSAGTTTGAAVRGRRFRFRYSGRAL